MVSLGVLQYLSPVLQLIWAVAVTHEHLSATTWLGFALGGEAVALFTADVARQLRRRRGRAQGLQPWHREAEQQLPSSDAGWLTRLR